MLQKNIETLFETIQATSKRIGIITVQLIDKTIFGNAPTQAEHNVTNNLWDVGVADKSLIPGAEIVSITFWDGSYTRKYSDQNPQGIITGKSGFSREARPSLF